MLNTCYVQSKDWWRTNTLCFDAMAGPRHLYTIYLMKVETAETSLMAGRFTKFVRQAQEHRVILSFKCGGDELNHLLSERIAWIHYQQGAWSFEVIPHNVGHFDIAFTFERPVTAVTFKLVWF